MPSRRRFLATLVSSAASLALARTASSAPSGASPARLSRGAWDDELRLGFAGPEASSAARGARMGAEEAARAATMLARRVSLVVDRDARRLVEERRVQVLIGGLEPAECDALARLAGERDVLWLNVGCADDALRGAGCRRRVFHVAPSEAMRRDAMRHDAMRHDAARREAPGPWPEGARAVAWHPALERFGAEQLNARWRARFGGAMDGMDDAAWAAWFAVKVAWEGSSRARSAEPARLASWLERADTRFDGHKGRPLSFRPWDHQLRQPLYVVAGAPGAETVAEVPPPPRGEESAAESLDRLGAGAEASACRWGAS